MDKNTTSQREVKQFADRLLKRMERNGLQISYPLILEGIAAGFGEKSWNTLSALLGKTTPKASQYMEKLATTLEWCLSPKGDFGPIGHQSPFDAGIDDIAPSPSTSLVLGAPGKGKTTLLGLAMLSFCLPIGLPRRFGAVDVGSALTGIAETMKSMVPPRDRKAIATHRLQISREHAVNMFDTPLGYRMPQGVNAADIVHFIALLVMDVPTQVQGQGDKSIIYSLAQETMEVAYAAVSDKTLNGTPKPYAKGVDPGVDKALDGEAPPATWWECVDRLTANGAILEAMRAQRHAVPMVFDLLEASASEYIKTRYGNIRCQGTSEPLLSMFRRQISAMLRAIPNLCAPTNLDMTSSRINVVDISQCTPLGGGAFSSKCSAVAFLLARRLVTFEIFHNEVGKPDVPELYQGHHAALRHMRTLASCMLVYDEFHIYSMFEGMVAWQVAVDMNEASRNSVAIMTVSQISDVFSDTMMAAHGHLWLLGVASQTGGDKTAKRFGLDAETSRIMMTRLNGPGSNGLPSLRVSSRDKGRGLMFVHSLSGIDLWRLASAPIEMLLRQELGDRIGFSEAIRRLCIRYPNGNAQKDFRSLKRDQVAGEIARVVDELAQEIG